VGWERNFPCRRRVIPAVNSAIKHVRHCLLHVALGPAQRPQCLAPTNSHHCQLLNLLTKVKNQIDKNTVDGVNTKSEVKKANESIKFKIKKLLME
jgi:hypothetical protein